MKTILSVIGSLTIFGVVAFIVDKLTSIEESCSKNEEAIDSIMKVALHVKDDRKNTIGFSHEDVA